MIYVYMSNHMYVGASAAGAGCTAAGAKPSAASDAKVDSSGTPHSNNDNMFNKRLKTMLDKEKKIMYV